MKRAVAAAFLLPLLITAIAGAFFVVSAFDTSEYDPEIVVYSPVEGRTYTVNSVKLRFTVKPVPAPGMTELKDCTISYVLDGKTGAMLDPPNVNGDITLEGLSNGEHEVKIYAAAHYMYTVGVGGGFSASSQATVRFTVDAGAAPSVSVSGLEEYTTRKVTLNITTNMPDAKTTYSVDGQANVTVPNNAWVRQDEGYQYSVTLSDMAEGAHTLTAYIMDAMDRTATAEKAFTVKAADDDSTLEPEPNGALPTIAIIAIIASVAAVGIGILLYFKKRKR